MPLPRPYNSDKAEDSHFGSINTFFQKKYANTCILFNNGIRLLRIIKKAQ